MNRRVLAMLLWLGLAACSNPEKAWEIAAREDTSEGYLQFLAQYPDGEFAELARERMDALKESRSWERAQFRDRLEDYRRFVENYPASEFAPAAQARIREMQRDAAWSAAEDSDDVAVLESFLERFPDAPQAAAARRLIAALAVEPEPAAPTPPPEPVGDFRVQLGAFRTAAAAEREVRRLVASFADALPTPVRIETPVENGRRWFLLKSRPLDGPAARAACEALSAAGQQCVIINR